MSLTCSRRSGIGSEVQGEHSTADARLLKSTTPHHRHTSHVHAPQCCSVLQSYTSISQRGNPVPTKARPDLNCCSSELHNHPS